MRIKPINFTTAKDLLTYLDPIKVEEFKNFYFRGQANSEWKALPAIWRNQKELYDGFLKRMPENECNLLEKKIDKIQITQNFASPERIKKWIYYIKFENYLLKSFYEMAKFSMERLVRYLNLLDQDVEIVIKKAKRNSKHMKLRVTYAH